LSGGEPTEPRGSHPRTRVLRLPTRRRPAALRRICDSRVVLERFDRVLPIGFWSRQLARRQILCYLQWYAATDVHVSELDKRLDITCRTWVTLSNTGVTPELHWGYTGGYRQKRLLTSFFRHAASFWRERNCTGNMCENGQWSYTKLVLA